MPVPQQIPKISQTRDIIGCYEKYHITGGQKGRKKTFQSFC